MVHWILSYTLPVCYIYFVVCLGVGWGVGGGGWGGGGAEVGGNNQKGTTLPSGMCLLNSARELFTLIITHAVELVTEHCIDHHVIKDCFTERHNAVGESFVLQDTMFGTNIFLGGDIYYVILMLLT